MKTETKFVYDWLMLYVRFLELQYVYLNNMSVTSHDYSKDSFFTKINFTISGKKTIKPEYITLEFPVCINIFSVYRALHEMPCNVTTNINEDIVARALKANTVWELLEKET
jgi:hypothetical protein